MQSAPLFPGIALEWEAELGAEWEAEREAEYVCPETLRKVPARGLPAAESVVRAIPVGGGRAAFLLEEGGKLAVALYECSSDTFRLAVRLQIASSARYQRRTAQLHFNGELLVCKLPVDGLPSHTRILVFDSELHVARDEIQVYEGALRPVMPAGGGDCLDYETMTKVDALGRRTKIAIPTDADVNSVWPARRFEIADDIQSTRLVFRGVPGDKYFVSDGVASDKYEYFVSDGDRILDVWGDFGTRLGVVGKNYLYYHAGSHGLHLRKFGDRELIQFILREYKRYWRLEICIRHDLAAAFVFSHAAVRSREYCAVDLRLAAELELAAARAAVGSLPDAEPEPLPRFVLRCFVAEDAAVRAQPHRFGFRPSAWVSLSDRVRVETVPDEAEGEAQEPR